MSLWNRSVSLLLAVLVSGPAWPQRLEESYQVYSEHPRLLLKARRLRLLRREKERQSMRWQQFEMLMAGRARMPEPGFALALYSQTTREPSYCKQAVQWALGPGNDLRQVALIFDWCQAALSEAESRSLAAKLAAGIKQAARATGISAMRGRVLAAIALAGHVPEVPERQLRLAVQEWWRGEMVPALESGQSAVAREDIYALSEILHAIRDNLYIDLREPIPGFFKELPQYLLLSYYPAPYPAPENEYRIPAAKDGEPDLQRAVLSRAAELSLVAYDPNIQENQFLQGWLIHDSFLMRGPLGITYEFLWANPYLPGLSYYHVPLACHDRTFGRLFLRSSWEDDAKWLGYFDGQLQLFEKGEVRVVRNPGVFGPIRIADAVVVSARGAFRFTIEEASVNVVFVVGLKPHRNYDVEVDDEEMREEKTDAGGILSTTISSRAGVGVRIRPASTAPTVSSQ